MIFLLQLPTLATANYKNQQDLLVLQAQNELIDGAAFKDGLSSYDFNKKNIVLAYAEGAACGNNVIDSGEQCDDGNTTANDGCSATCTNEVCGNGLLEWNEQCDDGNTTANDGCNTACQNEICDLCSCNVVYEDNYDDYNPYSSDIPEEFNTTDIFARMALNSSTDEKQVSIAESDLLHKVDEGIKTIKAGKKSKFVRSFKGKGDGNISVTLYGKKKKGKKDKGKNKVIKFDVVCTVAPSMNCQNNRVGPPVDHLVPSSDCPVFMEGLIGKPYCVRTMTNQDLPDGGPGKCTECYNVPANAPPPIGAGLPNGCRVTHPICFVLNPINVGENRCGSCSSTLRPTIVNGQNTNCNDIEGSMGTVCDRRGFSPTFGTCIPCNAPGVGTTDGRGTATDAQQDALCARLYENANYVCNRTTGRCEPRASN